MKELYMLLLDEERTLHSHPFGVGVTCNRELAEEWKNYKISESDFTFRSYEILRELKSNNLDQLLKEL